MPLTAAQTADFKEAFAIFDKEKTGLVSQTTLGVILRSLGQIPGNQDIESMYKEHAQGVGTEAEGIDVEGVLKAAARMVEKAEIEPPKESLKAAFEAFDKDNSGKLSAAEIRNMIVNCGERIDEDEVDEMMGDIDNSGDGMVDFKEFAEFVMKPVSYAQ